MAQTEHAGLKGVYDLHVHASPSIFRRWGDAEKTVKICQDAGMSGLILKAHHGSTTELANTLNCRFKINVFGGIVLNYFVGGLNPYAVDACCALGGKIVWLPTIHAAAHSPLGRFEFQEPKTTSIPDEGIRIAEHNDLVRPMYEILEILNNRKTILATGHLSSGEIKILSTVIHKKPYNVRLLVNHVHFYRPALSNEDIAVLKNKNTWFEISHFTQKIQAADIKKAARTIKDHPDAQWIMVSDSGQPGNPPPEALRHFRDMLLEQGIGHRQIKKMMCSTPKELLCE